MERGALENVAPFLVSRQWYRTAVVADPNTYEAAGRKLCEYFKQMGIQYQLCLLEGNEQGDVVADESTLVRAFVEIPRETDVLLAVGAGTVHDVVRFVGDKLNKRFISIPTAASVDGFTSAGAPLILRGVKKTIQACSPVAVFADLDVLSKAPAALTAAGFGDMLAKYTSLVDWQVSRWIADEPYCTEAAAVTRKALDECIIHIDRIGEGTVRGMEILMRSLIQSGLAMLWVGHSRPASGAEHHLSHFWEMELLRNHQPQVLHGSKVGVATILISRLYHRLADLDFQQHLGNLGDSSAIGNRLRDHGSEIQQLFKEIPGPDRLSHWLKKVGGSATAEELGIDSDLVQQSMKKAYHLRDRYTGLKLANDLNII
ncbi:hypothetical protein CHM34_12330 [Paludifilum halophilum]|uniref:Sn-glycerol-1-phosphate dehydrogenase n=2 Tax=Paludifilum halophilum TaxID=1642702 RepID=A0A235B5Y0_9BACL|nr:hypothetical protein CHM34_12330 [Paludifilum halophilum]